MASMREAYARKIANTELKCEELLRQKEDSCNSWYKEKKTEMAKMQAGCAIMQMLFQKKRRRIQQDLEDERAEFVRQQQACDETVRQLKTEHQEAMRRLSQDFDAKLAECEARAVDLEKVRIGLEERSEKLEDMLGESQSQVKRSQEDIERQRNDIEELQRRLVMAERTEELARRNAQIESLQEELKKVRKQMVDKRHAEAEALRKELMEYVKFIVHILPEDWKSHMGRPGSEGLQPGQLEERMAALPPGSGRRPSMSLEHGAQAPALPPRILPPVSLVGSPSGTNRPHYARTSDGFFAPPPPETPRRPRPSPPARAR